MYFAINVVAMRRWDCRFWLLLLYIAICFNLCFSEKWMENPFSRLWSAILIHILIYISYITWMFWEILNFVTVFISEKMCFFLANQVCWKMECVPWEKGINFSEQYNLISVDESGFIHELYTLFHPIRVTHIQFFFDFKFITWDVVDASMTMTMTMTIDLMGWNEVENCENAGKAAIAYCYT